MCSFRARERINANDIAGSREELILFLLSNAMLRIHSSIKTKIPWNLRSKLTGAMEISKFNFRNGIIYARNAAYTHHYLTRRVTKEYSEFGSTQHLIHSPSACVSAWVKGGERDRTNTRFRRYTLLAFVWKTHSKTIHRCIARTFWPMVNRRSLHDSDPLLNLFILFLAARAQTGPDGIRISPNSLC